MNIQLIKKGSKVASSLAIFAAMSLLASACGSDNTSTTVEIKSASCASGSVAGAGSTFVQALAQQWIKDYNAKCKSAIINYQGVGSGAGVQQFTSGTVDFAGSDVPLKTDEQTAVDTKFGKVLNVPWSAGGIAVMYKLTDFNDLQLSGPIIGAIFQGKIKNWNDKLIADDNPGKTLPNKPITVIHRSDGSGTTAAFTAYLNAASRGEWTAGEGKDIKWPVGQGAKGSDGVTAQLKTTEGAISYAEVSFAKSADISMARVKNASGIYVGPTSAGVTAALKNVQVPADLKIKMNYMPSDEAAYPITTVTYVIVPEAPKDLKKAELMKAFINYALTSGQASADKLSYAPLPQNVVDPAKNALNAMVTK